MTPEIETAIRREYEGFKPEIIRTVSSKLAGDGVRPLDSDLDFSYNEAWHALYMKLAAGEEVENRKGFLVTVTHRRALNEFHSWHPSRRANVAEMDSLASTADVEESIDASDQLRQFREGLRSRLTTREQQAATLCYLHDLSRPEAAKVMGVSPRRMEKIMDGAASRIQELIGEIKAGEFCDGMSSTIRAYAVGLLDPEGERYELARDHLDHCPACRRQVLVLRGFGAVVPPAPAVFLLLGGASGGGSAAAVGAHAANPGGGAASAGGSSGAGASGGAVGTGALVAAGVGALAVAGIVAAIATGTFGGESAGPADSGAGSPTADTAALTAAARAEKQARRQAARAKAQRAATRQARRKQASAKARREAAAATAAAAAAAAAVEPPVPQEAPVPVEPVPDATTPTPQGEDGSTPDREKKQPPVKDAASEFELR